MQLTEEAWFKLKFDGKPVVDALGELEKQLQDTKAAQKDLEKGTKEWAESKAQVKELEAQIKQVREEMGVSGMTVKQLEGYYRQLNREIKDLTPGTEEYKKKAADLTEVNTALSNHRANTRAVQEEHKSVWTNVKSYIAGAFSIAALFEAGRLVVNFFIDSVKEFRAFQSAAQDLSAVTGATGKDLEYLKQQAKEVGPTMGKSGAEMLEAYKLMASAKPELLANKEALVETTKAAITLSQAGKIDLAAATKVTAESLNQFGESANQAGRFINVVAAGAKEGSAEIEEMGMSLKASGTVAKAAGLSFEQTNAVLQSMSTIALKGEQAGTMLRNVLLKLQSDAKDTNPEIVGLEKALDNVAKKNYTAADMAKLFGTENVVAARHIVEHRKEIGELTTKLTGTQEAYKQAAKNNDTLDHEMAKMKATISGLSTDLVQSFIPAMTKGVQTVVSMVNTVRAVPGFLNENKTAFAALGLAILAFNGHLIVAEANSIRLAAVEKARQIWTQSATAAQWLLNTAMTANPIGALVAGIAVLVGVLTTVYNKSVTVRAGVNGLWQAMQTAASVAAQFVKAMLSMDIKGMADAMLNGGKNIADAFNKGYADQLAKERPKQLAAHKTHVDTKISTEKAGAQTIATDSVLENEKALQKKQAAAERHRAAEEKKAAAAAKKEADETVKQSSDALKKIEELRVAAIKDDEQREIAHLRLRTQREIENIGQSKARTEIKTEWEKSLNAQLERDIAKVQEDHRKKKADEEEKARQERDQRERTTSNAVATAAYEAHRQSLERQLSDTNLNANARKQIAQQLAEAERQETLRKIEAQYQAELARLNKEKADAIRTAQEKGQSVDQIENQFRQQFSAAELQRRTSETAAEQKFQEEKKEIEKKALDQRRENKKEWFSAVKSLMDGDFKSFSDILTKKLAGENKQLTESQKKQIETIDTVGQYTVMATQALQKLSQMKLEKELSNINKEKNSQLAAWKEKYDKGLINKDDYEKGVDKINKDADAKAKEAQLKAFKRQQALDIAMAVINAAQAALKSLATLGWPLGLIGVAASAVAAGIQIALIKRQQPPSLRHGGYIRNAGVPEGSNHGPQYGMGGIALVRRDSGEEVGEMEGNEPIMVLSQNTYKNNKRVVDSLLHSSLHRSGAPIMKQGGLFGSDGGSYGDYLPRQFGRSGRMFQNGGWMDNVNQEYDQGSYSGGSSGGDTGSSSSGDTGSTDTSSADATTSLTNEEIQKSQALMEAIGKNTAATVDALKNVETTLTNLQQQVYYSSSSDQNVMTTQFASLRSELKNALDAQTTTQGVQNVMLRIAILNGFEKLQSTMKFEFPSLGKELVEELAASRTSMTMNLLLLRLGLTTNLTSLEKTTKAGFDTLTTSTQKDLARLEDSLHTDLETLQTMLQEEFNELELNTALRYVATRTERKQQHTSLETLLKTELNNWQKTNATALSGLQDTTKTELRTVQTILSGSRNEQNYHSALLKIIADKNLSVSVQSFVSVWNQINVVVDKSDFK